jgi:hypothetical protein
LGWCPALTEVATTSQQDVNERMETDPCALLVTGVAISLAGSGGDRTGRGDDDFLRSATLPPSQELMALVILNVPVL